MASVDNNLKKNISILLVLQVVNQLIPLAIVPVLSRSLGVSEYGGLAYSLVIAQSLVLLTDFGFNLSATAGVAEQRKDPAALSRYVSSVLHAKLVLLSKACVALVILWAVDLLAWKVTTLCGVILIVIAQTLQPNWLLQGLEAMKWLAYSNLTGRLVYLLLVYGMMYSSISSEGVLFANAMGAFLTAIPGWMVAKKFDVRVQESTQTEVVERIRESAGFFFSRLATSAYTLGGSIFLGAFATPVQMGLYAAAEQIYKGTQALISAAPQAIYPYMVRTKRVDVLLRLTFLSVVVCLAFNMVIFLYGSELVRVVFGESFGEASRVLQIFGITLTISTCAAMFGYPLLGVFGRSDVANTSVVAAAVVQLMLLMCLVIMGWTSAVQVAFCVLMSESTVLSIRSVVGLKLVRTSKRN